MTYRLTPKLSISAEGKRLERESKIPLDLPPQSYVDNRFMLLLGYSTGPQYSAISRR